MTGREAEACFEVTAQGLVCWEYVVPQFGSYHEPEVGALFPSLNNAVFRAYRYDAEQLPWLKRRV